MIADGQLRHTDNMCVDTLGGRVGGKLGMYQCHGEGGNQVILTSLWSLYKMFIDTVKPKGWFTMTLA